MPVPRRKSINALYTGQRSPNKPGQTKDQDTKTPDSDDEDRALEWATRVPSIKEGETVTWSAQQLAEGLPLRKDVKGLRSTTPPDFMSRVQTYNLPEAAVATAENPARAIGTGNLSDSLRANAAGVLSTLAYSGHMDNHKRDLKDDIVEYSDEE